MAIRLGKNYPVRVGAGFVTRVQSFGVNKGGNLEMTYEMGSSSPVGADRATIEYTGNLAWNPVDNLVEQRLVGATGTSTVSLNQLLAATGILLQSKTDGINNAKVTSLEYSCQVGAAMQASVQVRGNAWNDGDAALAASTITGAGDYKSKSIAVVVNGQRAARVASFRLTASAQAEDQFEMGTEDPFETTTEVPAVSAEVEFWEDTLATGMMENDPTSPHDVIIGVDGGKLLTMKNAVWQDTGVRGSVRGAGTRRYSYQSKGDPTTDGLLISFNTAPTCTLTGSITGTGAVAGQFVTFTATPSDADGVYAVHFYRGTTLLLTDKTNPYNCGWTAVAGTHVFTAKAEDIYGMKTASTAYSVTVS